MVTSISMPASRSGSPITPDHPRGGIGESRHRIADQHPRTRVAQIEGGGDGFGQRPGEDQLAPFVAPQHHIVDAGIDQQFVGEFGADHPVLACQDGQCRDLAAFQPGQQVILAVAGDRRDKDEHLDQHHEENREGQEAPGKGVHEHAVI
jgi:hypothetical protein